MDELPTRARILIAIALRGTVRDPLDLVVAVKGMGVHNLVHQLWRLQKAGLISFTEAHEGGLSVPRKIRLTKAGERVVRENGWLE